MMSVGNQARQDQAQRTAVGIVVDRTVTLKAYENTKTTSMQRL
jgi:hypothetical protein